MAKKKPAVTVTVLEELNSVDIDTLIPYANNPRNNDNAVEKVRKSLLRFGYVKVSIGIDENNVLLYGHTTLKAIKELGWATVPKVSRISGLSERDKRAYRLADNRLQEASYWEPSLLMNEIDYLRAMDFEIVDIGFTDDDLKDYELTEDKPQKAVKTMKLRTGAKYVCPNCGYELNPVEKPKKAQ